MRITSTNIGNAIKSLRTLRGMTQLELAKRAGLGQPQVAKIESRAKNPSVTSFVALMEALDAQVHVLTNEEVNAPNQPRGGDSG